MLVCLECQFENPDRNKFCQKCGASLTERQCPSCGAMVALDAETCHSCGTFTGTFWRAIVQPKVETTCQSQNPFQSAVSNFLDVGQRYRLLDPLTPEAIAPVGTDVRVLDCQPLSPSQLDLFCKEQNLPVEGIETLSDHCQIPPIALDYLELEQQLYPSLPGVRDAWEESDRTIVLLEDRQLFPPLVAFWQQQTLASFQVLHLFHQMAELWMALQPRGYASSLLQMDNVRIDEDQLLYLQRLYTDTAPETATLKHLGQFWKTLLKDQSELPSGDSLRHLCEDMIAEIVATPEILRSQLEAIAMELQNTPGQMDSIFPPPEDTTAETTADLTPPFAATDEPPPPVALAAPLAADISLSASPTLLDLTDTDDDAPVDEGEDIPTIILPMILISLEESGQSDVGRQRDHNEDFFCIQAEILKQEAMAERKLQVKGLYILCDGMGGHASGEVASETAAQTLQDYFVQHWTDELPSEAVIREGVLAANRTLYDMNQKNDSSGSGRMGTTLVMVLIQGTQVAVTHVGDSRLYRFSRRLGLEQITVDHEVGQREIQRGIDPAIAYARPDAYQLTQALGPRDEQFVNPDVQFIDLNEDQLLLLCSDGLTDNELLEKYCSSHIEPLLDSQSNLEQGVNALIELANVHNGHDNITAIVVRARVRPNLAKLRRA